MTSELAMKLKSSRQCDIVGRPESRNRKIHSCIVGKTVKAFQGDSTFSVRTTGYHGGKGLTPYLLPHTQVNLR